MAIRGILAAVPGLDARPGRAEGCGTRWPTAARLLRDDRGASASQYALIATFICLAIIGGIASLGAGISAMYNKPTNVVGNLAT